MTLDEMYIEKLKEEPELKRLLELKDIINKKYVLKIVSFKNKEALYLEAKENKYLDYNKAKEEFIKIKKELYSIPEVKEYFLLERKINEMIESDLNEIKSSISNKFIKNNSIKI